MTMWHRRHVIKWLSAYVHDELPTDTAQRVAHHLAECPRCCGRLETIAQGARLAAHLPMQPAPTALDHSLRRALAARVPPDAARQPTRRPWFHAAGLGAVAVGLFVAFWAYTARPRAVDLASYLDQVQARETTPDAIGGSPVAFEEMPSTVALDAAGIASTRESPLEGYVLRTARARTVGRHRVVQLVYARNGDLFTVFVAPMQVPFALGDRSSEPTRVGNIPCRRVDCPRTTTVLFGEGAFQGVLVSRVRDDKSTAAILRYFVRVYANPTS
jgi:hypothetical protein